MMVSPNHQVLSRHDQKKTPASAPDLMAKHPTPAPLGCQDLGYPPLRTSAALMPARFRDFLQRLIAADEIEGSTEEVDLRHGGAVSPT
jgi:hypothetical protein